MRRLIYPPEVHGGIVLVVALAGVAVNLAATVVLAGASRESLNVRGAFLHVATDLAAFCGTALAGALILATGRTEFDPIASLLVAALMVWAGVGLLRDSARILLERAPGDIDPEAVGRAIVVRARRRRDARPPRLDGHERVPRALGARPRRAGCGLPCPAAAARALLADRFGLEHTTLQVEHAAEGPRRVALGRPFRRRTPLGHRD